MEFPFDISRILKDPVTVWDRFNVVQITSKDNAAHLREIVDRMGAASAKAQGLHTPVTSYNILLQNPDQRLYLFTEDKHVVGLIKIGNKKLFIRSELDVHKEIMPLCVLDFYVHESRQRTGRGKLLFEAMLERERLPAHKLGYDRPSPKFLSFLRKHYDLSNFTPQANNFVVFKQYFEDFVYSPSRNELPNASVSMRPLTGQHRRRNSYDERVHGRPQIDQASQSYYTPQKPQARPDDMAPLALNKLPQNGYNPFSLKADTPTKQDSFRSNNSFPTKQPNANNLPLDMRSNTGTDDYRYNGRHDEDNHSAYDEREHEARDHREPQERNERSNSRSTDAQPISYDDHTISPDDYKNKNSRSSTPTRRRDSTPQPPFGLSRNSYAFSTSSSDYGRYSPAGKQTPPPNGYTNNPSTPSPSPSKSNTSYNVGANGRTTPTKNLTDTDNYNISNGEYETPTRGRSPSRQRAESSLSETSPSVTRARSNSMERTHVPPKGLGTLGAFTQSFAHPIKFEKDLTDPPHRPYTYKDPSLFPPRRAELQPTRSPAYRLGPASTINSREMDRLEDSMRNALSSIDTNEKKVSLMEQGGYRAVSPEPKLPPSRQEFYQSPQSRSIFSSIQPSASPPPARSVSPARFGSREDLADRPDSTFSKTDFHKKFHSEHPSLLSTSPVPPRVHPNARSRQSPFPS